MNDNADHRLDALFAAARQEPRDTGRAEWSFETRLMARVREEGSPFAPIITWAWRLCPFFAAIAVATAFWSQTAGAREKTEEYLLAQTTPRDEEAAMRTYLTGEN